MRSTTQAEKDNSEEKSRSLQERLGFLPYKYMHKNNTQRFE